MPHGNSGLVGTALVGIRMLIMALCSCMVPVIYQIRGQSIKIIFQKTQHGAKFYQSARGGYRGVFGFAGWHNFLRGGRYGATDVPK